MSVAGQIIAFIVALFLVVGALHLLHKEKFLYCAILATLALIACLSGQSWFQGLIKTEVISRAFTTMEAYGKKLDEFQLTTAKMKEELAQHQTQIDKHQKELDEQQGKIRSSQFNIAEQQTNVADQYQQISTVQTELATAQTNVNIQQKKIEDVEYLVQNLFSKTTFEQFPFSDTNRVAIRTFSNGVFHVLLTLKHVPIPGSIQGILQSGGTQIPLQPMQPAANLVSTYFTAGTTRDGAVIHLQYCRDTRQTNLVQKVTAKGTDIYVDGVRVPFKE